MDWRWEVSEAWRYASGLLLYDLNTLQRSAHVRLVTRYGVIFLVAAVIVAMNPWKAGDWARYYSAATIHRLLPYGFTWADAPKTTVVLADDRYLNDPIAAGGPEETVWPLRYAVYANVLEQAADLGARAVFLDFTISDAREDETYGYFVETLGQVSRRIPIFIVSGSVDSGIGRPARPEILNLIRRGANITLVSATSGRRAAPDLPSYVMKSSSDGYPPLPLALESKLCITKGCAPTTNRREMEIIWAAPPVASQCSAFPSRDPSLGYDGCKSAADSPWMRGLQLFILQPLRGPCLLLRGGEGCLIQSSDAIANTFSRSMLLGDFLSGNLAARHRVDVAGTIVMVGLDFAYARDRVQSPVYGDTPGVNAHALALANLGQFGDRYFEAGPEGQLDKFKDDLGTVLWICVIALLLEIKLTAIWSFDQSNSQLWRTPSCMVLATVCVVAFAIWMRQSPANWLGALGAMSTALAVAKAVIDLNDQGAARLQQWRSATTKRSDG